MCVKERNKVATFLAEKERMGEMFGSEEAEERMKQVSSLIHIGRRGEVSFWLVADKRVRYRLR